MSSVARGKSKWAPKEKTVYKGWVKGGDKGVFIQNAFVWLITR